MTAYYDMPLAHVRGPMTLLNRLKLLANLRLEQLSRHMPRVSFKQQK